MTPPWPKVALPTMRSPVGTPAALTGIAVSSSAVAAATTKNDRRSLDITFSFMAAEAAHIVEPRRKPWAWSAGSHLLSIEEDPPSGSNSPWRGIPAVPGWDGRFQGRHCRFLATGCRLVEVGVRIQVA